MTTEISLDQAARIMRNAMRDTIKRHSTWYLAQGVIMVIGGFIALLYPLMSSIAVVLLLGWLLIISGFVQLFSLIGARHVPHFWLQLISVVLAMVIGFLFIGNPEGGLLTLTLLLIVFFMVGGIARIVFALTIRPFPQWGWVLASGIVGVVLSAVLWTAMPVTAAWLLGILVGIQLISEGTALAYMAWHVRQAPDDTK